MSVVDRWSLLSALEFESFSFLQQVILLLSVLVSGLLAMYAIHAWSLTLWAFQRKKPPPVSPPTVWPSVSVHIPVYNEKSVISRLLNSVVATDYPHDKLEIIVVDDSNDGTTELLHSYHERYPGLVTVIHRQGREGFKAGALQTALVRSKSEFVAVFDADHVPPSDFLRRMIPYVYSDKTIAFAQARPTYPHNGNSWVTRALSLGMDAYAFVDQEARFSANLLTHFSGGGGVFRRTAIMSVGGWNSETLAEDLDLSIRLRLSGWRYVYDSSVACPGEAPTSFQILKQQQFRWASGFAGCLKKHLPSLVATRQMSLIQKAEALVYLTGYVASPLIAIGVLLAVLYCLVFPLEFILNGFRHNALAAFTVLMSGLIYTAPLAMFAVAVYRSTGKWSRRVKRVVDLVYLGALSVGIFLTSARAVLNGFLNRAAYFYRTPKQGDAARSWGGSLKMSGMPRVCVAVPTYNERENISKLIPSLLRVFRDKEIDGWVLIVDDASPDGTGDVAEALSKEHPNIRVIHREGKLGIGSAYKDAFHEALLDRETRIVVEMDADLSHDPIYLPSILRAAQLSGGVGLGSRYVQGGHIVGWSTKRRIVSWGANFLARTILRLQVKDATSGYRAFTREALTKIGYMDAGTKAYAFQVEMLHRCAQGEFRIEEVPITFYERQLGKSKLTRRDILDFLKTILQLRLTI